MNKVSVVIRNKNQEKALKFLLFNLKNRYSEDIEEVIVLDNLSTDQSIPIAREFGAKVVNVKNFTYGGSANLAASVAQNKIVVIFSAHAYPVSHDFFAQIISRFNKNKNLAGLRCLHNSSDFTKFISGIKVEEDPNGAGLIFCGSAFNRDVWRENPFRDDISTFEDKEWTARVLKKGFQIEFSPSIFCYDIKRTKSERFFRFRNDIKGSYQLWNIKPSIGSAFKGFFVSFFKASKNYFMDVFFIIQRFFFTLRFLTYKSIK